MKQNYFGIFGSRTKMRRYTSVRKIESNDTLPLQSVTPFKMTLRHFRWTNKGVGISNSTSGDWGHDGNSLRRTIRQLQIGIETSMTPGEAFW